MDLWEGAISEVKAGGLQAGNANSVVGTNIATVTSRPGDQTWAFSKRILKPSAAKHWIKRNAKRERCVCPRTVRQHCHKTWHNVLAVGLPSSMGAWQIGLWPILNLYLKYLMQHLELATDKDKKPCPADLTADLISELYSFSPKSQFSQRHLTYTFSL